PRAIQELNNSGILVSVGSSLISVSVVLALFEIREKQIFAEKVKEELSNSLLDPGSVIERFRETQSDQIMLSCLDKKFHSNKAQSIGLLTFLNRFKEKHINAHYNPEWHIIVSEQDGSYNRVRVTITLRKRQVRQKFSVRCVLRNPDRGLGASTTNYMDDQHDFTWNFINDMGDDLLASEFELEEVFVGRKNIPLLAPERNEAEIKYESEPFEMHEEMIQEEDGTYLYSFTYSVNQLRAVPAIGTSMRRASKGFKAEIIYNPNHIKNIEAFENMTCSDTEFPVISNDPQVGYISIEYTGWVFLGSGIVFVWSY
ncbi:MAG: hypothetical protein AAGH40_14785, partial [Verrucomicrobiota bacterium]